MSTLTLSTGRTLTGYADMFGISGDLEVGYGYDGSLYVDGVDPENDWIADERRLTKADQIALGELMIERWQRFIARAKT